MSGSRWKRSRKPCCANISVAISAIGEKRRQPSPAAPLFPPLPLEGLSEPRLGAETEVAVMLPRRLRGRLGNASLNRRNELKLQEVSERDTSVCTNASTLIQASERDE